MPCPYNVILGRDTVLPWTLYYSGLGDGNAVSLRYYFG
jgi:hypothetical protein